MKRLGRKAFLSMCGAVAAAQQNPHPGKEEEPKRMPDGTLQSEAILKAEHTRMLAEAARLVSLSRDIESELEKNQHHVLSLGMLKKLEEIEKTAKKMRGRINR